MTSLEVQGSPQVISSDVNGSLDILASARQIYTYSGLDSLCIFVKQSLTIECTCHPPPKKNRELFIATARQICPSLNCVLRNKFGNFSKPLQFSNSQASLNQIPTQVANACSCFNGDQ
jgi:hypothetical protein